jgi:pilus assembly protein FimV
MPDEDTATEQEDDATLDVSTGGESTVETPTIEQQFETLEATGELPSLADRSIDDVVADAAGGLSTDETAEIDLDDLGLDLDGLADSGIEGFAAGDALSDLDDTAESKTLKVDDDLEVTGENPDLAAATGLHEGLDIGDLDDTSTELEAADAGEVTGRHPALADEDSLTDTDTGIGIDTSLLDATGQTQILSADMAVETAGDVGSALTDDDKTMLAPAMDSAAQAELSDDAATLLAPLDDDADDGDFDFAKTEALPKDVFTGNMADETSEMPGLAGGADMDLDLDDLTAALKVSEMDTINQGRDDATVEQPRIRPSADIDLDVGMQVDDDDNAVTAKIGPDDMTGDLHDARTMTEVGTKLDLARAYVDMGDPGGARSILEEVVDEGDEGQKQQAQQLLDSLPG